MIDYYTIDAQHIYIGAVQIDPYAPLPPGAVTPPPDTTGDEGAAMAWFIEHNGASYDLIGNLSFICPLIPHSRPPWPAA